MDTQVVELIGRNYLVNQFLQAGIEVAIPVRDKGIDLIVYLDQSEALEGYSARPVQLKAASWRSFSIDKKYERYPHLILAYVWHLHHPFETVVYGLDYKAAVDVADRMGYTKTKSWEKGSYTTTRPSEKLLTYLEPFKMTPENWKQKLREF